MMAGDTNFFVNFPPVSYRFGDKELPVQFQDLSVYIDIFDQVSEYSTFYENYQIQNHERPDHVSFNLYGTTNHYWTFFLLNDKLRLSGWPLDNHRIYRQSKIYYPHITFTTTGAVYRRDFNRYDTSASLEMFDVGRYLWFKDSEILAKILKVDHTIGQFTVELVEPYQVKFPIEDRGNFVYGIKKSMEYEFLRYNDLVNDFGVPGTDPELIALAGLVELELDRTDFLTLDGPQFIRTPMESSRVPAVITPESESIHHFEDENGDYVFPTYYRPNDLYEGPFAIDWQSMNTIKSVTRLERLQLLNDDQRSIHVIKPDSINQITNEFKNLLKK